MGYRDFRVFRCIKKPRTILWKDTPAFCKRIIEDGTYQQILKEHAPIHVTTVRDTFRNFIFAVAVHHGFPLDKESRKLKNIIKEKEKWLKAIDTYKI